MSTRFEKLQKKCIRLSVKHEGKQINGVFSPEYMIRDNIRYRFLKDHLGSVLAVVNSLNGAIAQQITYDEFGQVLSDSNPGFQPFGFAGGMYDPDTKLVRFGAREYNGAIGRWMSKDPILFNGGDTNLYGYVMQDPVNFTDRNGLDRDGEAAANAGESLLDTYCRNGGNCRQIGKQPPSWTPKEIGQQMGKNLGNGDPFGNPLPHEARNPWDTSPNGVRTPPDNLPKPQIPGLQNPACGTSKCCQ